jgi:hypothetical protein
MQLAALLPPATCILQTNRNGEAMRREASTATRSGAIGLLAGLAGSLCCLGPSAAVLLGLGSSSVLAGLAFDRTLALAGGGMLLAAGLWLARRHTRACEVQWHARWRQLALMLLSFALAYGLLGYALPQFAARQADLATAGVVRAPAVSPAGSIRRATLIIDKMSCPPCAASVRGAFARKPYVRRFTAETNNEQVTVEYDSRQASVRDIIAIFPRAYGITLLADEALP